MDSGEVLVQETQPPSSAGASEGTENQAAAAHSSGEETGNTEGAEGTGAGNGPPAPNRGSDDAPGDDDRPPGAQFFSSKSEFLLEKYGVPEVLQTATYIHARKSGVKLGAVLLDYQYPPVFGPRI
jgi:hypothetical protein